MGELEEEFKKVTESGEKARQTRFLRSQQDLKVKMEAEAEARAAGGEDGAAGGEAATEVNEAADPFDLLDAVDISKSTLLKDFAEKLVCIRGVSVFSRLKKITFINHLGI
jgi:cytoskeleton-associated protein 5